MMVHPMSTLTIYRKDSNNFREFYQDNIIIGTSRNTHGFSMNEIVVYQNKIPKVSLREINLFTWFLRHIPIISIFFMLFINSRFVFIQDGKKIGYAKDKWFTPIRNFVIYEDIYKIYIHKNNIFSLTKNGIQVALYKKESHPKNKCNTYSISFSQQESPEIIQLFCIFIDLFFFDCYNGRVIEKNIVFSDHHADHTLWTPDQQS